MFGKFVRVLQNVAKGFGDAAQTVAHEGGKVIDKGLKVTGDAAQTVAHEGGKVIDKGLKVTGDAAQTVAHEGGKVIDKGLKVTGDAAQTVAHEGGKVIDKGLKTAGEVGDGIGKGIRQAAEENNVLNMGAREKALKELEGAYNTYQQKRAELEDRLVRLYNLRKGIAEKTLPSVELYLSELANAPREFKVGARELSLVAQEFTGIAEQVKSEVKKTDQKAMTGVALAAGGGAATAAMAPTLAMAVATTFGTASTGTAISTLSGAAATQAALAWLGGGTLAAGGGGTALGAQVISVLSGPIGWAIAAAGIAATGWFVDKKNREIAEEATEKTITIRSESARLGTIRESTERLINQTGKHQKGVTDHLSWIRQNAPQDYKHFTDQDKTELMALINNVRSLTQLLSERIDPTEGS